MPRLLKRVTLLFAVLALGLALATWVLVQVLAHNVVKDDTEPVRARLLEDWKQNAERLEAALAATTAWNTPSAPTPPQLGCLVPWLGDAPAVQQHRARCPDAPPPLDEATVTALESAGDTLLVAPEKGPTATRDFGWMAQLHGQDGWLSAAGTPYEFWEVDPALHSITEAPLLDGRQLRALAALRLLEGARTGQLDDAVNDVTALARALLGRPVLVDQLVGVLLLERTRALLDAVGQPDSGVDAATVKALRTARLAGGQLWHPWVPGAYRARFLPKLGEASRCAALGELLLPLEMGPWLAEHHAPFAEELGAALATAPCGSDFITRALAARRALPKTAWRRALRDVELFSRAESGELLPSLVVVVIDRSDTAQAALVEVLLSTSASVPFPPAAP